MLRLEQSAVERGNLLLSLNRQKCRLMLIVKSFQGIAILTISASSRG